MRKEKSARLYLRRELHKRIKVTAAKEGKTMRQFIEDLIEEEIKEHKL